MAGRLVAASGPVKERVVGKIHVDHRVVIRDAEQRIVSDDHYESFAVAEPNYRQAVASTSRNLEVTLQHGARVVFRANGQS